MALLGVVMPGVENHSLAVLGRSLDDARLAHTVIPFRGFAGMREMIDDVLLASPRVCGISLQSTEAALAALAFAKLLRAAGYSGTIVVGGHVANLAADEILACGAVDIVVELAGEAALVGLARGQHWRTLPGTITREGRGLPAQPVAVQTIPRTRLGEHLGFGAADLIVSRGCPAHCGYCCVASVADATERASGVRHIVRDVDRIADEIADAIALGARAFHFMDDNILPLDPDAALAWTRQLHGALAARQLPSIAFSLQLRADVVTPALADALVALGLVRTYVGVDGYTSGQLRALGRSAKAHAGIEAIELLSARGVLCVANALVVGPTIGFDTIEREIEGLSAIRHAPVHLMRIEARPGTIYHRRASARGLIEGGPLLPLYRFEDERTLLIGQVITSLPTRISERSVPIALYDLAWAVGVARRLAPQLDIATAYDTYARVTAEWNRDQIRLLRAAAAAACEGTAAVAQLIASERAFVRAYDEALLRACDRAIAEVERAMSAMHRRPVRAHMRGRMLGALAVSMSLAACAPDDHGHADAAIDTVATLADAMPDTLPACADPTLSASYYNYDACSCFGDMGFGTYLKITFNDRGEVTAITYFDGTPLPADVEKCALDLFAPHCYPTYAGTMQEIPACYQWIA